jgi:hypothetical protein
VTLREEYRMRVFEYRVLRKIFGPKRDVVTGGWRKLHNEELPNLCSSPNIITMMMSCLGMGRTFIWYTSPVPFSICTVNRVAELISVRDGRPLSSEPQIMRGRHFMPRVLQ